jgi:acetylornithine deacetylase/succinyl-diaminopimelate desuccinylase-like protein
VLEQTWARPTAEVNGMWGGYTGEGFKTVIAAKASAKVSFRLVGKQDPDQMRAMPSGPMSRCGFQPIAAPASAPHGGSPAIQLPFDSPVVTKARNALTDEWPNPAVMIGMGGSIPIVGDFQNILGLQSMLCGFGLTDDRIHSPNEKYDLTSFCRRNTLLGAHSRRTITCTDRCI